MDSEGGEGGKVGEDRKGKEQNDFFVWDSFFDLACLKTVGLAALIVVVCPGVEYPDIFPLF